jgi:hypothetical protein
VAPGRGADVVLTNHQSAGTGGGTGGHGQEEEDELGSRRHGWGSGPACCASGPQCSDYWLPANHAGAHHLHFVFVREWKNTEIEKL